MRKTPLDSWIRDRLTLGSHMPLTRSLMEDYQLAKLREVVAYLKESNPFYRALLPVSFDPFTMDFEAFSHLPFTYPRDLSSVGIGMVSASLNDITRIVTLNTSGTTGDEKRVFFTEEDMELTIDFFRVGMLTMVEKGATVIIFLPGKKPDSVGDLLARALERLGVEAVIHGPVTDIAAARDEILSHTSPCLVGIPTQILSIARSDAPQKTIPKGWVDSVLLSTDYIPLSITKALDELWGCKVFCHYGMTEMGLGGGVECEARAGCHMREADLYVEIIDPLTGVPVEDGVSGEVVFTTLTRRGMPLLRYRTGDVAGFLPGPCPCGSVIKRLGKVLGRLGAEVRLKNGLNITLQDLDETLFSVDGVLNYLAEIAHDDGKNRLYLTFYTAGSKKHEVPAKVREALSQSPTLRRAFEQGGLSLGGVELTCQDWITTGVRKRMIVDRRVAV